LSGLRGKLSPTADFIAWLKGVIAYRRRLDTAATLSDARAGLQDALRFGTTLLGDIAAGGLTQPLLADALCWSIVFHELLGLPSPRAMSAWRDAMGWLNAHPDSDRCRTGLSPHAPYSVHQALIRASSGLGVPLAIHLAESAAEVELLEEHGGRFVDFLRDLGVWEEDSLAPSLEWIVWQTSRSPVALLAHGNYLDPRARFGPSTAIVYCPRTHAAFGHPLHAFRAFLAHDTRVALGTDSLASNPDLDVLGEARFIHERFPEFPGEQLLRLATLAGAEALGFADLTGSLEPGKSADLVSVPLPDLDAADPHSLLFGKNSAEMQPRRTMWRGEWRTL
jgi:cytosine/adenosine deaminase-related metal-dependent hydrolase